MRCAPFFPMAMVGEPSEALAKDGGEGGIRTPGRGFGPYNGLANSRLQPLGHLSAACPGIGFLPGPAEYNTEAGIRGPRHGCRISAPTRTPGRFSGFYRGKVLSNIVRITL